MDVCSRLMLTLLVVLPAGLFAGVTTAEGLQRFELTYGSAGRNRGIVVYEPGQPGPKALVIYLTGTAIEPSETVGPGYLTALAERGYVVAAVDYDNGYLQRFDCQTLQRKARQIFDRADPQSALNVLYGATSADPGMGLGLVGFSQGAWLAQRAAPLLGEVSLKGALLLGSGTTLRFNFARFERDLGCGVLDAGRPPRVLAINGGSDFVYTYDAAAPSRTEQLIEQLTAVTGRYCVESPCLDAADGSGWVIVADHETTDEEAGHEFFLLEATRQIDPVWYLTGEPWGLNATASWLDKAMKCD